MYKIYIKRALDFILSILTLILLSPVLLILTITGVIIMKGNPFFTQLRPGKDEKIFKLIKFRSMTCKTDEKGDLLPDEKRLTKYGQFLRSTSLDELPELINIIKGDMAIVGPRPLLVQYLPLYNEDQRKRHVVRPGLTGYAQVHGRNRITWEEKFNLDIFYVNHISFITDATIIMSTFLSVIRRQNTNSLSCATMTVFEGSESDNNVIKESVQ